MKVFNFIHVLWMSCLLAACDNGHGSGTPLQTHVALPLPGVPSVIAYSGPQGIFDAPNSTFDSVITILDTGEVYGMDLIDHRVAGFFHGTVDSGGTKISTRSMVEYNAFDGGYIQDVDLSAVFTNPSLQVWLKFPFGNFDSKAVGQKHYADGDPHQIYIDPIGLASIAGRYDGELSSVGTTMQRYSPISGLALSSSGAFTATAGNCRFDGTLSRHGSTGAFDAVAKVTGADCAIAGPMNGLMTPVTLAAADKTLGIQLLSADASKSAMLFVQERHAPTSAH